METRAVVIMEDGRATQTLILYRTLHASLVRFDNNHTADKNAI